jgi:4-hydroxy-3-methylbut-2-enyl diphosphate reductase
MAALLADGRFTLGYPKRGAIVSGEVVGITKEGAWVNLGTKADSLLPADELADASLEVGQRADFFVVSEPNEDGQAMLSLKAARSWSELSNLLETNATETVTITKVIRSKANDHIAGAIASIRGQRGFIPASQLSGRRDTLDKAVGTSVPVKVITVDPVERKLILSQRKAEAEMRDSFFATVQKGDIVSGRVVNIVDFGAFVDLGCGVTGLVHRSEIGNRSSAKPSELLTVGQELELLVLNVNPETKKVDLSLKQVAQARVLSTLSKGQVVEGKVARFMEYGAFIDLGGIDGLLHNSELPGDSPRSRPSAKDVLSIGQTLKLVVIELNVESKKVGLSLRQLPKAAAEQA